MAPKGTNSKVSVLLDTSNTLGKEGNKPYSGKNKILYTKAVGTEVYELINEVWDLHLNSKFNSTTFKPREAKKFPEYFNYLGWCSWEGFGRSISEENLKKAVVSFEKGTIPIRYLLMDAGHMQTHPGDPFQYNALQRFKPFPKKFPTNYKSLLDMRKKDKIRWMGVWLAFLGGRDGIYPQNEMPSEIKKVLKKTHMNTLVPKGDLVSAEVFYSNFINSYVAEPGWDFTKIDFQSRTLTHYAGGEESNHPVKNNKGAFANAFEAATNLTIGLENTLDNKNLGLINCNSLHPFSLFNSSNSVVARCSEDYKVYDIGRARSHMFHSYATMPVLAKTIWGDHDMFHSSDTISGQMMAISKAMSGGPIYLSDKPNHFMEENIRPLCYVDGKLLRPLAPAAPTEKSFFIDGQSEKEAYMAFAPLKNKSVSVVAYNLYAKYEISEQVLIQLKKENVSKEILDMLRNSKQKIFVNNDDLVAFISASIIQEKANRKYKNTVYKTILKMASGSKVSGSVTSSIYKKAGVLIQPYQGNWEIPKEGLYCYNWYAKSGSLLNNDLTFAIDSFGDKLYHLVPINKGWGIVGDVSKYLSPAGYELISNTENEIQLALVEGGTIVVYKECENLVATVGQVNSLGNNLWEIVVPNKEKKVKIIGAKL